MRNFKREKFIWIVVVFCLLCVTTFLIGCKREDKYAIQRIKDTIGIDIPVNAEIAFNWYESGFQDFTQYTVFKMADDSEKWIKEKSFLNNKNENFEYFFNMYFKDWIKNKIPDEYEPDFESSYCWLEIDNNYLIYDRQDCEPMVFLTGF